MGGDIFRGKRSNLVSGSATADVEGKPNPADSFATKETLLGILRVFMLANIAAPELGTLGTVPSSSPPSFTLEDWRGVTAALFQSPLSCI